MSEFSIQSGTGGTHFTCQASEMSEMLCISEHSQKSLIFDDSEHAQMFEIRDFKKIGNVSFPINHESF